MNGGVGISGDTTQATKLESLKTSINELKEITCSSTGRLSAFTNRLIGPETPSIEDKLSQSQPSSPGQLASLADAIADLRINVLSMRDTTDRLTNSGVA